MKLAFLYAITAFAFCTGTSSAWAVQSHAGKVDIELDRVDSTGTLKLAQITGDLHLDWAAGKCEIQIGTLFYYCSLDHSKDLLNSKGTLIMQKLPVIHYDLGGLNALLLAVGKTVPSPALSFNMEVLIENATAPRTSGFDLPTYTCVQCEVTDQPSNKVVLTNAYSGSIIRTVEIADDSLGEAKLVFTVTLKQMHANAAAFQIVGDNAAGNFGP